MHRIKRQRRFDRSLAGDLQHALSAAGYQVRIANIMRWNIFPVDLIVILSIWEGGMPVWLAMGVALFIVLVFYASGWELNIYRNKKRELEIIQQKLHDQSEH